LQAHKKKAQTGGEGDSCIKGSTKQRNQLHNHKQAQLFGHDGERGADGVYEELSFELLDFVHSYFSELVVVAAFEGIGFDEFNHAKHFYLGLYASTSL